MFQASIVIGSDCCPGKDVGLPRADSSWRPAAFFFSSGLLLCSTAWSMAILTCIKYHVSRLFPHDWRELWWQPLTPLKIRLSLRRLCHGSAHPIRLFLRLLGPVPWRFRLPRHQLKPFELKNNPKVLLLRQDGIFQLRCIPLFQMRDTPLCSVYRIYEYMCAGYHSQVQYETEYFFFHPGPAQWSLDRIPDPKDDDVQRYAFVACVVEALVAAFNWRLSLGLQRDRSRLSLAELAANPPPQNFAPAWAIAVPSLPEPLNLEHTPDRRKTPFTARNIFGANNGHMYTI